jgi:hypothetical protein
MPAEIGVNLVDALDRRPDPPGRRGAGALGGPARAPGPPTQAAGRSELLDDEVQL